MSEDKLFINPPPGFDHDGNPIKNVLSNETLDEELERTRREVLLPFKYGWKWYDWAYEFYNSTNKINLLCAANQISKSSTQIRKCVNWATDQELWPSLWRNKPTQFWYLYPTKEQATIEFETKWSQFLPRGKMKDDPIFGWEEQYRNGFIIAIHFKSGVHVYFKTYAQNASSLQTGTCDAIFCDEELPVELYNELVFRVSATDGYFHMVFTATLGQDFWRRAMEPEEGDVEELPTALKMTVSLYDAMKYMDGTPSHWTLERIKAVEAKCSTQNEVLKRVHGKFIVLGGRKYEAFDLKRHMKKWHEIPKSWLIYEGADPGSGGENSHAAALCFIAVRPDFRAGRVFLAWRGDGEVTTAGDVFQKHTELKKQHKLQMTAQYYDWAAKDFGTIAQRAGDPFEPAEKSHELGEEFLNTLFKNDALLIYETPDTVKLGQELATLKKKTAKRNAKDNLSDALRYGITKIPWDWTFLNGTPSLDDEKPEEPLTAMQQEIKERRKAFTDDQESERQKIDDEFNEWNEAYDF